MFNLNKKSNLVGVDISASSIKVIELVKIGSTYAVDNYAVLPLEKDIFLDGVITDEIKISEALIEMFEKNNIKNKNIAVSVTSSNAFVKTIEVPLILNDEQIELKIKNEIKKIFNIDNPNEVLIDFFVSSEDNKKNKKEIVIAACRKDVINKIVESTKIAKLNCLVIDIESFILRNSYKKFIEVNLSNKIKNGIVAFIDIGANTINLKIMKSANILYQKDFNFGGKELTDKIREKYNLSESEAGFFKKFPDKLKSDDYYITILKDFNDKIKNNINNAIIGFYSSTEYSKIDGIVLAGGASMTTNLKETIENSLKIETSICNPFIGMPISKKINQERLYNDAPALLIACGLSSRELKNEL